MNSPLDIRQIRAFCVLARTGSFTQTARELHLTQSGVSHSMKALETEAGCRLLDRLGKKVVLTQAGEQLLHHAVKIMQEMETAQEALAHLGKWGRGRLRVGATTAVCQQIIPPVLLEFKESFPDHAIMIQPGDTPQLVSLLLSHGVDLAICLENENEPQLDFHPLFTDELHFIVSPLHPWARSGIVNRAELPRQSYILYSKHSITFRLIENYFRREDIMLNTVIEVGSIETTKELVKLGLGVSVFSPWVARKELEDGSLVALPLGKRKLKRSWGIHHLRGKRLNLAEETFIGLCRAATALFDSEPAAQSV